MFKQLWTTLRPDPRDAEIAELEKKVHGSPRDARPGIYNRLGDLFAQKGELRTAASWYGLGINSYLETGHFDPAAALCRKLISAVPDVVRARCTLAFLSLGKGFLGDAETEIGDYVRAAMEKNKTRHAVDRLRLMAQATRDAPTLDLIARHLRQLGDGAGADRVLEQKAALDSHPITEAEQRELWAQLLRRTILELQVERDTTATNWYD
jgi:hypothetical protein